MIKLKRKGLVSYLNLSYSCRDVVLTMLTLRPSPQSAFYEICRILQPEDIVVAILFRCQYLLQGNNTCSLLCLPQTFQMPCYSETVHLIYKTPHILHQVCQVACVSLEFQKNLPQETAKKEGSGNNFYQFLCGYVCLEPFSFQGKSQDTESSNN